VQTKGSIDSLILNLIKALSNSAVQGIVAVSDEKQLKKITDQCDSIKMISDLKLRTWNYKEVLQNYEALEAVNESINKLNLVPDGFYTKN
jgi:5,10-methylenetetrahydrofolate reductase